MKINTYIDHTLLSPTAGREEIKNLCDEAIDHQFFAVCVNSCFVKLAKEVLKESPVKVATTIGFPLGACSPEAKIEETRQAIKDGTDEIDMVINIGFLKDGRHEEVRDEIRAIKEAIGNKLLKVILETCFLDEEEIAKASKLSMEAGADFIKTSTGFGSRGASHEDIRIMRKAVGNKLRIKASGGIRDFESAKTYIDLGVDRIGTSSGIKIVSGNKR